MIVLCRTLFLSQCIPDYSVWQLYKAKSAIVHRSKKFMLHIIALHSGHALHHQNSRE